MKDEGVRQQSRLLRWDSRPVNESERLAMLRASKASQLRASFDALEVQNQGRVAIADVLGSPFRITAARQFGERIAGWNDAVFGKSAFGAPSAAGKTEGQCRIERAAINAGLAAPSYAAAAAAGKVPLV